MSAAPVGVVVSRGSSVQRTREPFEDLQRGRSWHGEWAVGGVDDARAHGQGTAAYGVRVEELQSHAAADHVDDGVHGADLMEGYLLGVLVVDGALRDGQTAEGIQSARETPARGGPHLL